MKEVLLPGAMLESIDPSADSASNASKQGRSAGKEESGEARERFPATQIPQLQSISVHHIEKIESLLRKLFRLEPSDVINEYLLNLYIAAAGAPEKLIKYLRHLLETGVHADRRLSLAFTNQIIEAFQLHYLHLKQRP